MKAYGNIEKGDASKLIEADAPKPTPGPKDLLVKVKGVSVNPVDYKVREWFDAPEGSPHRILGWDAAGVVEAVGDQVTSYRVGDEVFYAGEFTKPGTNAEYQCVDERIVGKKPSSLSFADAAAFPLTSITAWELLFDSLCVKEGEGEGQSVLILGAAGGVGSILVQLVKKLTKLTVVSTASRPDTIDWVKKMGSDHVITHREPLPPQMKELGLTPKYVICLNGTEGHLEGIIELIKPRGHIAIIDDPTSLDLTKFPNFKLKALTFSWEFMFARSMFQTEDMDAQQKLLNRVSEMFESRDLVSIVNKCLGKLNLDTLKAAHEVQASGKVIGKNVLEVDF
ncbi:alcohol dehydrogenase-like protein SE_1777 [Seminavis robusta]|uniref:Alcohol dehydrogenase-like protein SE_1777 n=1 Tax=Seminavis robusta TaxID=568900 RepID=A0A9N8H324_9STRA|nr:alcohol dehydrogenase-like protein SE_1777 [Seminavis robusta]|eukprot:Sro19_g013310.1 alcohol dehydrogenase-like protein SE_1777 (338) ;mRNA; f:33132-34339